MMAHGRLIAFNKPCGVLCQFSPHSHRMTLKDYVRVPGVYPAGRLDADSEGLVLLTDDGMLQSRLSDPKHGKRKVYLVQVEGEPEDQVLQELRSGVWLDDRKTLPARVKCIDEPAWLWPRDPPIRYRRTVPSAWLELGLREGRNRQVRRMTAALGHPTLRLVRISIGPYALDGLVPGEWREADPWQMATRSRQKSAGGTVRP
ncbi:MAG: pseudouridine synthase [Gammaproteobacteria bacterium]